jgi:hypothetical protein
MVTPGPYSFNCPIILGNSSTIIVPASTAAYLITAVVNNDIDVPIQPSSFFVKEQTSKIFYLYKSKRTGGPVITDNPVESEINTEDLDPGGPIDQDAKEVGQVTNEDERLDLSHNPNNLAAVRVNNLTNVTITGVEFTEAGGAIYPQPPGMRIRAKHNMSIILKPDPVKYTVKITFTDTSNPPQSPKIVRNLTFEAYGTSKKINDIYFWLGKDGNYHVNPDPDDNYDGTNTGFPSDDKINDGTGGGGGGGGGTSVPGDHEGDSPGISHEGNKDLGLVGVKNLTALGKAANITKITFTYQDTVTTFVMEPGPNAGHEKSILLRPGLWSFVIEHTGVGNDNPVRGEKQVVKAEIFPLQYIYFYRNRNGIYTSWTENTPPTDSDPGSTVNETVLDGYGTFSIENNSTYSTVAEIKWPEGGSDTGDRYLIEVFPQNTAEIQVPMGSGSVAFRIGTKITFGRAMSGITVRENQITRIRYNDTLEDITNIPPGSGLISIENKTSTGVVEGMILYDRNLNDTEISNESFEPTPGPIPSGQSGKVLVLNAPAPSNQYIAQIQMRIGTDYFNIERLIYVNNNTTVIQITQADIDDGSDGTVTNPGGVSVASIRVFNSYARSYGINENGGQLIPPLNIFKYYLTTVQAPTIPPTTNVSNGLYSGVDGSVTQFKIAVGNNAALGPIPPGVYRLMVVAGFYTWNMYAEHAVINGLRLSPELITYDCGEVIILTGYETQYHFSPPGNNGREIQNGFVTFTIGATNYGAAANPSYVEIVVPPKYGWGNTTSTTASVGHNSSLLTVSNNWDDAPLTALYLWDLKGLARTGVLSAAPNSAITSQGASNTFLYFDGTSVIERNRRFPYNNAGHNQTVTSALTGLTKRTTSPSKYVIFNYGQVIPNGQTKGPFIIPPGEYWCRYWDNNGGGNVYGATSTRWRYVDLRAMGGRTAAATLDNTTRFQWLGQESYEEDEMINPDTQTPWVYPVTGIKWAMTSASATPRYMKLQWTKPSTTTNFTGVLVAIFDSQGFQVGDTMAPTPKSLTIYGTNTKSKGVDVGTANTYRVIRIVNTYDNDGIPVLEEVYDYGHSSDDASPQLISSSTFPGIPSGYYIWHRALTSTGTTTYNGEVPEVRELPKGDYTAYAWSYTANTLGDPAKRRYSEVANAALEKKD